jgi:hypothetical protein
MHPILPHGDLSRVATNTWQVEGSLPFPLKRNMTVHRLHDGRLLLYSVVARILQFLGPAGGSFGVARIVKFRQVRDKSALRGWLAALAARGDISSVLAAHGPPLTSGVTAALNQAATNL